MTGHEGLTTITVSASLRDDLHAWASSQDEASLAGVLESLLERAMEDEDRRGVEHAQPSPGEEDHGAGLGDARGRATEAMTWPDPTLDAIRTRQDLARHLIGLAGRLRDGDVVAENSSPESLIEAAGRWTGSMDGFFANVMKGPVPKDPDWAMVAAIFRAALVYEEDEAARPPIVKVKTPSFVRPACSRSPYTAQTSPDSRPGMLACTLPAATSVHSAAMSSADRAG